MTILGSFGFPSEIAWLQEKLLAKPAFIFMSFWMIGRQMVIFIAGLGNIPQTLYEAASLDGAGFWGENAQSHHPPDDAADLLQYGHGDHQFIPIFCPGHDHDRRRPAKRHLFAVLNIYRKGFEYFNVGYAAALSWEFFVIIVGFTIVQFVMSRRWVYYESD